MSQVFRYFATLRVVATLGLCAALIFVVGCGKKAGPDGKTVAGKKRIILLNNTADPYWDAANAGLTKAAGDLKLADKGYTAVMDTNVGGDAGQIEKLRQYAQQNDIVGIVISPTSGKNRAIAEELRKLKDKGVVIGCIDSDLVGDLQSSREFYIGTDNTSAGKALGTAATVIKPAGGEYVQFVGSDSQQNAIQRMDGFTAASGEKFKQMDRKIDDTDKKRARDNVRDVMDKFPQLSVLVGIWAYNAPAIVDVVKDKKVRDKMTILTFDADSEAVRAMGEDQIDAMIVQDPFGMGYESVRYIFAKLEKDDKTQKEMFPNLGKPDGDVLDTGLKLVVQPGSPILESAEIKALGAKVKAMPLSEFQAWLKQYDLKGS